MAVGYGMWILYYPSLVFPSILLVVCIIYYRYEDSRIVKRLGLTKTWHWAALVIFLTIIINFVIQMFFPVHLPVM